MTPFTAGMNVLEVGGGSQPSFHPNIDVRKVDGVDIVADLSEKWPVESGSYDGVFSKFVIEHVSWRGVKHFVSELHRVIKPGGTAFVISPNTQAQMKWALEQGDDYERISQCLFGDLDYPENSHKAAFNPSFAIRLFREAGFLDVAVLPFGELKTDMVIEARKPMQTPPSAATSPLEVTPAQAWTPEERRLAYNRHYFDGGRGKVGGYSREGYRDFPVHWLTFQKIMERKPESVLELGAARGYILKRLEDAGVQVQGIEISRHCILTRVVDPIMEWDMTQVPWPFRDQQFDLCFSGAVLEHIPEQFIDAVAGEIRRVSRRGLHGIDFGHHDDGFDKTHCSFRPKSFWVEKLNQTGAATQEVVDKEDLEKGPVPLPASDGKLKLNLGSYTTMSHYGWINVDQHDLAGWAAANGFDYRRHDLSRGIPVPDSCIDLLYASHFLEHFTYDQGAAFLVECRRVLKPGGLMRLIVPDGRLLTESYLRGDMGLYDELSDGCAGASCQATKLWELLFSGHLAMYDKEGLQAALLKAGFTDIERMPFRMSRSRQMLKETVDLFPTLSLFVEAVKT